MSDSAESSQPEPKPKRRWYQYSLRTLIVLLVFGAVVLGWRVNRARKNRERVATVEKAVEKAVIELEGIGRMGCRVQVRTTAACMRRVMVFILCILLSVEIYWWC